MDKRFEGKKCPFCKTLFKEDDVIVVCSTCEMPHHLSCWQENNGCTTFGCTGNIKETVGNVGTTSQNSIVQPYQKETTESKDTQSGAENENSAPVRRYETLSEEEPCVIYENTPILVEKVTLIIDHHTDNVMARCSFRSLTDKPIQALLVDVDCTDPWGNSSGKVEGFQFLDLKTKRDSTFGQTKPIQLPNAVTRSVNIIIKKVLYADRTVDEATSDFTTIPKQESLESFFGSPDLAKEYARETNEKAKYKVAEGTHYWRCACGAVNHLSDSACYSCKAIKSDLLKKLYPEQIASNLAAYEKEKKLKAEKEQAERDEQLRQAEERMRLAQEEKEKKDREEAEQKALQKKKKRKKIIKLISIISGAILLVTFLVYATIRHVIPYVHYVNACKSLEAQEFDDAYKAFIELGAFSDSADKALETIYQKGVYLMGEGSYTDAITEFKKVEDYKDSKDQIKESNYQYAIECFDSGEYKTSVDKFKLVKDYKDVDERLPEAKYQYALELKGNSKWRDASSLFGELGDYKDSKDNYKETYYQYGLGLLDGYSYTTAVTVFRTLGDYKSSEDKLNEAKYGYVRENKNNYDTTTYSYLKDLKDINYKDTDDIYDDLYEWRVINIRFNSNSNGTNNESSISRYKPVYCHFELTGGTPGDSIYIICKDYRPDGSSNKNSTDSEYYCGETGWFGWDHGLYTNPSYGATGTLTMEFYDENDNLLGKGSVNIN